MNFNFRKAVPVSDVPSSKVEQSDVKPIPDTLGYYVSKDGLVFKKKGKSLVPLKPYAHKRHGYMTATITDLKGVRKTRGIHQLVALAFLGPCKLGNVVDHIDRDKHNNNVANLRYITKKENRLNSSSVNVTEDNFFKIREMVENGHDLKDVAAQNDVKVSTVKHICKAIHFLGTDYPEIEY